MNKYAREIKPGVFVDVYDVLKAFKVTCPAMAHAVKKALAPGQRGHKDTLQDMREVIQSVQRAIELEGGERDEENQLTDFLFNTLHEELQIQTDFSLFKKNLLTQFKGQA